MQIIDFLDEYKYIIVLSIVFTLILHTLIFKPLINIRYYLKQGVQSWGFVPLVGKQIWSILQDGKRYGDVIYSQKMIHYKRDINADVSNVLGRPILTLYDSNLIKDFFVNKNQYYIKSKMGESLTDAMFGKGIIFSEGEQWKKSRNIASRLFNFEKINSYIPLIENITLQVLGQIKNNEKFDLLLELEQITGNISLSIFFGRTLDGQTLYGKSLSDVIKQTQVQSMKCFLSPLFILSAGKILPSNFKKSTKDYKNKIRQLVIEELENIGQGQSSLVQLYAKEEQFIGGIPPNALVEDISNQILNFYAAGRDTSSHLVNMILYYLVQDEKIMNKILNEIKDIQGQINWQQIQRLPYLEAVIKETLRIYGPSIGILAREAIQTHQLQGITVKKGTYVQIGIASNNHHPRRFPEPFKFIPERWIDQNPLDNQFQFVPFSAGVRNCIGQHLSTVMTKIIVISILRNFKICLDPSYELKFVLTQQYSPVGPMNFIFQNLKT